MSDPNLYGNIGGAHYSCVPVRLIGGTKGFSIGPSAATRKCVRIAYVGPETYTGIWESSYSCVQVRLIGETKGFSIGPSAATRKCVRIAYVGPETYTGIWESSYSCVQVRLIGETTVSRRYTSCMRSFFSYTPGGGVLRCITV